MPDPPAVSDDPTAPYQLSLDEIRRQIRSQVQVNGLPDNGKEFVFLRCAQPGLRLRRDRDLRHLDRRYCAADLERRALARPAHIRRD